jgi:hypothetical protein
MAAVVNRQVNVYINSGEAQKAYDVLIKKEKDLNEQLAKTSDPRRIKALNAELDKLKDPIDRAGKKLRGELLPTLRDLEIATRKWQNEFKKTGDPAALKKFQAFNAELTVAKKELNGLAVSQQSLTKGGVFTASFWANIAANGLQRVTQFIGTAITQTITWATQIEGVQNRFDKINKEGLLDELRKATRGTVSDLELMKAAVRADNFKIPLDKLGTLLKFASQRARETGDNVNYLVESIILGISRKSIPIMDNLGISATELQKEFKKTGNFATAAFKIVNNELQKAGPYVETFADKVDRVKTFFTNAATETAKFVIKLVEGRKTANQLFDEAKIKTEAYERSLGPLLTRYDELKGKTILNKDEQSELRGIIEKIVQIVPQAATEFDKYGRALDINKQKVIDFREENSKFLQQREASAIKSLTTQAQSEVNEINRLIAARDKSQANFKKYGTSQATINEALQISQTAIAKFNNKLIETTDVLVNKFKVQLPAGIQEMRDKALQLKFDVEKATPVAAPTKDEPTEEEIKAAKEKAEAAARKALEAAKKAAEERKQLIEELNKIEFELSLFGLTQIDKEFKELNRKYDQLRGRAKSDGEILNRISILFHTERLQIIQNFVQREVDIWKQGQKEMLSDADKVIANNLDFIKRVTAAINEPASDFIKRSNKNKQDEQDEEDALKKARIASDIQQHIGYLQQISDINAIFGQAKTEKENAELEADRHRNEQKKNNLDKRLKAGTISQQQYDREIQKIERDQAKREKAVRLKQFEREKEASITQALINGALAVTNIWATTPKADFGISTYIMLGLSALATLSSVASIAGRKAPEFAEGGKLGGRSHASGGNAVIDGNGRKIAEVEAGEGIVNKRTMADTRQYQVSGTASQIISSLNSMYGKNWEGGATLVPAWRSYNPQRMNYAAMKSVYASGGTFATPTATNQTSDNAVFEHLSAMISNMQATMLFIQQNGIPAYTVLTQHEKQQARMDSIRKDATLK